ncbi:MAG: hypothetical protein WD626_00950, partial [Bauldia sp.]
MERHAGLLGGQVPQCDLDRFVEGQPEIALIAPTVAGHTMHQRQRPLAFERGPGFLTKCPHDLGFIRQRMEKRLHKAQADGTGIGNELKPGYIHRVGPNLAVAHRAVAAEQAI